jgi:hypothetical protein
MMRIIRYDIMLQHGLPELCRAVQEAIDQYGCQPLGAPFVSSPGWYGQAMVTYETESN